MKFLLFVFTIFCFASPAFADIKVSDVHSFETSPGIKNGVLLMTIENTGDKADKLIGAKTTIDAMTQVHQMSMTGGIMKMRQVGGVAIPAGGKTVLDANGFHIMLIGLKKPLAAGTSFAVTLQFERGGEILTTVRVRSHGMDMKHMDMAH